MKTISIILLIGTFLGFSHEGQSQTQVVPPSFELTAGGNSFLGPLATAQRTYQLLIDSSQLTNLAGMELTGITFRSTPTTTSAWPPVAVTYSNYDIYLGEGVIPANRSLTFANNIVGPQQQVRSGPLNIAANSFPVGGVSSFGPAITFDNVYFYSGGALLLEIRHQGFSGTQRSVDAIGTSHALYGTGISAVWNGNYIPNATGSQGNAAVVQFSYAPGIAITSVMVSTQNNVPAFIDTNAGTLQMEAEILPSNANQMVNWSVVSLTGEATISTTGLMTAVADGYLYAKAVSLSDTTKADSLLVLIVNQVLGIPELGSRFDFKVYPNPTASGKLMVEVANDNFINGSELSISDVLGRRINSFKMNSNPFSIDVSRLIPGNYILNYSGGNNSVTERIVIQ